MKKIVLVVIVGLLGIGLAGRAIGPWAVRGEVEAPGSADTAGVAGRDGVMVLPELLAQWVEDRPSKVMIVDLRAQASYISRHIDLATNIPHTELSHLVTLQRLPRDRPVVVYADSDEAASRAVLAMRLAEVDAYALAGGLARWVAEVHPSNTDRDTRYRELLEYGQWVDVADRL